MRDTLTRTPLKYSRQQSRFWPPTIFDGNHLDLLKDRTSAIRDRPGGIQPAAQDTQVDPTIEVGANRRQTVADIRSLLNGKTAITGLANVDALTAGRAVGTGRLGRDLELRAGRARRDRSASRAVRSRRTDRALGTRGTRRPSGPLRPSGAAAQVSRAGDLPRIQRAIPVRVQAEVDGHSASGARGTGAEGNDAHGGVVTVDVGLGPSVRGTLADVELVGAPNVPNGAVD